MGESITVVRCPKCTKSNNLLKWDRNGNFLKCPDCGQWSMKEIQRGYGFIYRPIEDKTYGQNV